jgi:hypothetical protein
LVGGSAEVCFAAKHLILGQELRNRWREDHRRSCALGSCGIPSIWRSPTTRQPGGQPSTNRRVRNLALPPGCRVVALREVDGMPDPTHPTTLQALLVAAIPEICPPSEGMLLTSCCGC